MQALGAQAHECGIFNVEKENIQMNKTRIAGMLFDYRTENLS